MSKQEDDGTRLYQCARKYDKIVKQFDVLIELMNTSTRPPKRRRVSSSSGGSSVGPAAARQADNNEVLVQTVTRFLHELKPNPTPADPNCSTTPPSSTII